MTDGPDALKDLRWFLGILLLLGIVWFLSGGPDRGESPSAFFGGVEERADSELSPPDEQEQNRNRDAAEEEIEEARVDGTLSPYRELIELRRGTARSTDPDEEYLIIRADLGNQNAIAITGWTLESPLTGRRIALPTGERLLRLDAPATHNTVLLAPGQEAVVITGRSPIGRSFQTNVCTGYLEQFQDFTPRLSRQCPSPEDEPSVITHGPNRFSDACLDYIEDLPRCTINTEPLPLSFSQQCQAYINQDINYTSCVGFHRDDTDFLDNEWRIFLGRSSEFWKSRREVIKLLDENGHTVDAITY